MIGETSRALGAQRAAGVLIVHVNHLNLLNAGGPISVQPVGAL